MTGWMQRKANGCCEWGGYDLSCKGKNPQNPHLRRGRVSALDECSRWKGVRRGRAALLEPALSLSKRPRNAPEIAAGFRDRLRTRLPTGPWNEVPEVSAPSGRLTIARRCSRESGKSE